MSDYTQEELENKLVVTIGNLYIKHGIGGVDVGLIVDTILPLIKAREDCILEQISFHFAIPINDLRKVLR